MPDKIRSGKLAELSELEYAIKDYYINYEDIQLSKYSYTVEPLGFSSDNDDFVIVLAYLLDKSNNKVFLGSWGYDLVNKEVVLISKTNPSQSISANALVLRQVLD